MAIEMKMMPKTRASVLTDTLRALELLSPTKQRDLERDAGDVVNDIRSTLGISWLPFSVSTRLYDFVASGDLGQASQLGAAAVRITMAAPLLRPIASAALAVAGHKPESLFRMTHVAMAMMHQGFGPFKVHACGPGHFDGYWDQPPLEACRAIAWQHGMAGAFVEACRSFGPTSPSFSMHMKGDALHITGSW